MFFTDSFFVELRVHYAPLAREARSGLAERSRSVWAGECGVRVTPHRSEGWIESMAQHEWFMGGMVCLGVALGMVLAWLSTRRARAFRRHLLAELAEVERLEGGIERRFREILGNRSRWKRSQSTVRKPFSNTVNLAIETAALIYALVGLVNTVVRFDKSFDSPAQAYGILVFLSVIVGYIPAERIMSGRTAKEMDQVLDAMEEALEMKQTTTFLDRARKEWR